jgi:hypothetical protein
MTEAWSAIIVAGLTGLSGIVIAIVQKLRKENKEDHAFVRESLKVLHDDVKDVSSKLDDHISWHLKAKSRKS